MPTAFLIVVCDDQQRWFIDGQLAESEDEASAIVCENRKNVVQAIAFRMSQVQTAISQLKSLERALKSRAS